MQEPQPSEGAIRSNTFNNLDGKPGESRPQPRTIVRCVNQAQPKNRPRGARCPIAVTSTVYVARVSDKPPQTYILHTVAIFVVLVAAMVAFLIHQWG